MTITGKDRIWKVIKGKQPDRVPVFPELFYTSARYFGIKISEYLTTIEGMSESLIYCYKKFGYDGVNIAGDVLIEAETIGTKTSQPEDDLPKLLEPAIKSVKDLKRLEIPDPKKDGRMAIVFEATKKIVNTIGNEAFIMGGAMGPWNLSSQLRGVQNLMLDTIDRPNFVYDLLEFSTEVLIKYGKALLDTGVDLVEHGEALCSTSFISPKTYEDFVFKYHKKMFAALNNYGNGASCLHICGNIIPILKVMKKTEATIFDVDYQVDMNEAKKYAVVRGNINPAGILLKGSKDMVVKECKELIENVGPGGKFILSSGCDVAPDTPEENIYAMVESAREYGRYPIGKIIDIKGKI